MSRWEEQRDVFRTRDGFVAALDQSGGSTPKALGLYGLDESSWSNDEEMFDLVHQMRTRIMTSRVFDGSRILATILFENTMDREVAGKGTADYLWEEKKVVPILKVDKGLADEAHGVRLMKPIPALSQLLDRAIDKHVFGTKMRSVILQANSAGIDANVAQQFQLAAQILDKGLVPIIEPEVDIHCPEKAKAEELLKAALLSRLADVPEGKQVIFKLTPPEKNDLYAECVAHPSVLKVVALSGGYPREEACRRLAQQHGMVASFSRALTEGLSVNQSPEEFDQLLDASIQEIFEASKT
jgi:fructose-bisphosphate aldolase class I